MTQNKNLLLIFCRNPELGKVKKRLAAKIGEKSALEIYRFLLGHTAKVTKHLQVDKEVFYSEKIEENDLWEDGFFRKKLQVGSNLGNRMENAFQQGFLEGYEKIIIIGSDLYDLSPTDLEKAFSALEKTDYVVGPAKDGGYYLLGMKNLNSTVFRNKAWGTETVLQETLKDIKDGSITKLEERNDIDLFEDIKDHPVFQQFLGCGKTFELSKTSKVT